MDEKTNEQALDAFDEASVLFDQAGTRSAPAARASYDAARAAVLARMVPAGWKAVPVEPTPEMVEAYEDKWDSHGSVPSVERLWSAMLKATP